MPEYRELAPPPQIVDAVECLWCLRQTGGSAFVHRVVPDGCADILFARHGNHTTLHVVGPMTRFQDFKYFRPLLTVGVRFRPGMWTEQIGIPRDRITDALLPLDDLWGARARALLDRMAEARSAEDCASLLAQCVRPAEARTPVQQAIAWMETRRGCVSLDWVARQAALSVRQFRRVCLEQTGLSPKFLARVLRFRHALSKVAVEAGEHAGLAADCGYTDQSHFIAEFRQFAGETPSAYLGSQST